MLYAPLLHDLVKKLEELNNIGKTIEFTMESALDEILSFLDF